MLKTHKKTVILTSLVTLLPILLGLLLWDRLPDMMPTHWGFDGEPDNISSKAFAIFIIPLITLAGQWLVIGCSYLDPNNKGHNQKALGLILWILPMISLFNSLMVFSTALKLDLNMSAILFALLGMMFMSIGNYLPKIKRNSTLGIKVVWALANEENWNATHRFGGRVWVYGGMAMLILSFLPSESSIGLLIAVILALAFLPVIYSWQFYRKQVRSGIAVDLHGGLNKALPRWAQTLSIVLIVTIVAAVCWLLFTGSIDFQFGETSLRVEPNRYSGITVDYDRITDLELRQENVPGSRTWGFGSYKLLLGSFENEEFGSYTRYTYFKPESCIVIYSGEKVLVLSGADAAETQEIYQTLLEKTQ